jgi:hypothetical protein
MREILSYYALEGVEVHIIPWQNPISSYIPDYILYGEEVKAQYIEDIKVMLFDTPWLEIDPELLAAYPEYFGINTAKGLDIYVWRMDKDAPYEFGLLSHEGEEKRAYYSKVPDGLKGVPADTMREILSYYDLSNVNVSIIVCGRYGDITDGTFGYNQSKAKNAEKARRLLFGTSLQNPNAVTPYYNLCLKEIDQIVVNQDREYEENIDIFYQDADYMYFFTEEMSNYITVIYEDGSWESLRVALLTLHIRMSDLDRFGIKYYKAESQVENIIDTTRGADDECEGFYMDEDYVYRFPQRISHNITVYYKDGTSENLKDALKSGRIGDVTVLEWFGIYYFEFQRRPKN